MNWLDITIIVILIVFTAAGIARGFVRQVFSIAALAGGLVIGLIFFDVAGEIILRQDFIENRSIANVAGFLILFLVGYIVIQTLGWFTAKLIGTLKLSWLDRAAGGGLGIIFGVLLVFVIISSLGLYFGASDSAVKNSRLAPYIETAYMMIRESLPEELEDSLRRSRELVKEKGLQAAMRFNDSKTDAEINNKKQ